MGLDTTHDCWHGSYSSFYRWRREIAKAAKLPPLILMEGFCHPSAIRAQFNSGALTEDYMRDLHVLASDDLPIPWDYYEKDPLCILFRHSDCDGSIEWKDCERVADRLSEVVPNLKSKDAAATTIQFIRGLRQAFRAKENVEFH